MLRGRGDLSGALESYRAALTIAMSHGRVAGVLARQEARSDAAQALEQGRAIIVRLRQPSPDDAALPNDLARFDAQLAALKK